MVLLLVLSTLSLGWCVTQFQAAAVSEKLEKLAAFWIIGTFLLSWVSFGWVAILGYSSLPILLLLLTVSPLAYQLIRRRPQESWRKLWQTAQKVGFRRLLRKHIPLEQLTLVVVLLALFLPLFYTHYFQEKEGALYSGGTAWADLALHATLTNWFGFQEQLDLTNPIYGTEPTTYPFMINFLAGLYRRAGVSLQTSLFISAVPVVIATFLLLASSCKRYFQSFTVGVVAVALVWTTGSTAGFLSAFRDWQVYPGTTVEFLQTMPDYGHLSIENMHWSNTITDMVITQRGFVMGFSIWIVCAWLYITQYKTHKKAVLFKCAALIGLLPFAHVHSFAILLGLLLWVGAWAVWKKAMPLSNYLQSLALVATLSAGQLWWQFSQTESESFSQFKWGWYTQAPESIIMFWMRHWGAYVVLLVTYPLLAWYYPKLKRLVPVWSALLVLFLLNNTIQFQPNLYDNSKFLEAVQIFLCVVMAYLLVQLWKRGAVLLTLVLVLTLSSSGLLGIIREYQLSYQIASAAEVHVAEQLQAHTSTSDLFVTAPVHNHPAMMLGGRKSLLGYPGWLWTHGINPKEQEHAVATIYAGGPAATALIEEYDIKYVYISHHERYVLTVNEAYFSERYPVAFTSPQSGEITVYQVSD